MPCMQYTGKKMSQAELTSDWGFEFKGWRWEGARISQQKNRYSLDFFFLKEWQA